MRRIMKLLDESLHQRRRYVLCYLSSNEADRLGLFDRWEGKFTREVTLSGPGVLSAALYKGELYLGMAGKIARWGEKDAMGEGNLWDQLFVYNGELWALGYSIAEECNLLMNVLKGEQRRICGREYKFVTWISFKGKSAFAQYTTMSEDTVICELNVGEGELGEEIYRRRCSNLNYTGQFEFVGDCIVFSCPEGLFLYDMKRERERKLLGMGRGTRIEKFQLVEENPPEIVAGCVGKDSGYLLIGRMKKGLEGMKGKKKIRLEKTTKIVPLLVSGYELVEALGSVEEKRKSF